MTTQTIVPRAHYAANGVQTAFGFTFPVFDIQDMEVWIDQSLQPGSAYTISGVGVAVGGTVIFVVPPPASSQVTLRRRMPLNRIPEFPDTSVQAKPLNEEFTYHTAALQQLADEASLAVKRSFRSLSSADLTLPEPAAGRAIRWNDTGDGLINSAGDVDDILAQVTAQALACAADADAAAISQAAAGTSAAAAATAAAAAEAAAADVAKIEWRGAWSAITTYALNDVVSHDGSSWICVQAHTNQTPADTTWWDPLAAKGTDGTGIGDMLAANNLSDLASPASARTNLGVYSVAETDAAIAAAGPGAAILDRIAFLEKNLAVNTLRDQVDAGWSILNMVDGVADEFEDETGIDTGTSTNETYDATGDYYHNSATGYGADLTSGSFAIDDGQWVTATSVLYDNVFDDLGTSGTYSSRGATVSGVAWVGQDFGAGDQKHIRRVTIYQGNNLREIASVKVQSADTVGGTWTDIATATIALGANTIDLPASSARRCWRVLANANQADGYGWWMDEIQMMETASPPNMTLVSQAFTAGVTPTEARLVLLHQPVDATTLGTDCTIEASRDGGTTWTAGTLADDGAFDASTDILSATVDLAAQPSGVAMKWRFKTFNAKTQRLHGVWLQWR